MDGEPASGDLLRLIAATEIVLALAEKVDADIADEAILAELHELHERSSQALRRLAQQR